MATRTHLPTAMLTTRRTCRHLPRDALNSCSSCGPAAETSISLTVDYRCRLFAICWTLTLYNDVPIRANSRRSVGIQMRRRIEDFTEWTGLKTNKAVRITADRQRWPNVLLTAGWHCTDHDTTESCLIRKSDVDYAPIYTGLEKTRFLEKRFSRY